MQYSYSKACSRYGASMGRFFTPDSSMRDVIVRFYVQRVRIDSQGYDPGGAYWGTGEPLYVAFDEHRDVERFVRAPNRAAAKRAILALAPRCSFYR